MLQMRAGLKDHRMQMREGLKEAEAAGEGRKASKESLHM
jgi:hypothetical protein